MSIKSILKKIAQENCDVSEIKELIKKENLALDVYDFELGIRPIDFAAKVGNLEIIKFFIASGAQISCDETEIRSNNFLWWACNCKDKEKRSVILEWLINYVIQDQDIFNNDKITVFHIQAAMGKLPEHNSEIDLQDNINFTPFEFAHMVNPDNIDILKAWMPNKISKRVVWLLGKLGIWEHLENQLNPPSLDFNFKESALESLDNGITLAWLIVKAKKYELFKKLLSKINQAIDFNTRPYNSHHPEYGISLLKLLLDDNQHDLIIELVKRSPESLVTISDDQLDKLSKIFQSSSAADSLLKNLSDRYLTIDEYLKKSLPPNTVNLSNAYECMRKETNYKKRVKEARDNETHNVVSFFGKIKHKIQERILFSHQPLSLSDSKDNNIKEISVKEFEVIVSARGIPFQWVNDILIPEEVLDNLKIDAENIEEILRKTLEFSNKLVVCEINDSVGCGVWTKAAIKKGEVIGFYAGRMKCVKPLNTLSHDAYSFANKHKIFSYNNTNFGQTTAINYGNTSRFFNHAPKNLTDNYIFDSPVKKKNIQIANVIAKCKSPGFYIFEALIDIPECTQICFDYEREYWDDSLPQLFNKDSSLLDAKNYAAINGDLTFKVKHENYIAKFSVPPEVFIKICVNDISEGIELKGECIIANKESKIEKISLEKGVFRAKEIISALSSNYKLETLEAYCKLHLKRELPEKFKNNRTKMQEAEKNSTQFVI